MNMNPFEDKEFKEDFDLLMKALWHRNNAFNFDYNKFSYDVRDFDMDTKVIRLLEKFKEQYHSYIHI